MQDKIFKIWEEMRVNAGLRTPQEQKKALDEFNRWYKKATNFEQGEFHHLVHLNNVALRG